MHTKHDTCTGYNYTVRMKKKVIQIQRPVVLKSIILNICVLSISEEQLIIFPLVPIMYVTHDHIAIEDDNVISHFLQVLVIGWKTAVNHIIGNSDGCVPGY